MISELTVTSHRMVTLENPDREMRPQRRCKCSMCQKTQLEVFLTRTKEGGLQVDYEGEGWSLVQSVSDWWVQALIQVYQEKDQFRIRIR